MSNSIDKKEIQGLVDNINSLVRAATGALSNISRLAEEIMDSITEQPADQPFYKPPYIHGLHDPGGEWIMFNHDKPGWVLVTEAVGCDPADMYGRSYDHLSSQGLGVIVRINNGYEPAGTIPYVHQYEAFAKRVENFVRESSGCNIWIIGNETNHPVERPGGREEGIPILPLDYVKCYMKCRGAIKSIPGHEHDEVLVGAVAPWNNQTQYRGNETGDWVTYFRDIITAYGPSSYDGFTLHTYTHGPSPELITDRSVMHPPFAQRYYNFPAFIDFMNVIPSNMRHLPVYITETNQDQAWRDGHSTWVQKAYEYIDCWNSRGGQKVLALLLYRWPNIPGDRWGIQGKPGVVDDFAKAVQRGYRWK